MDAAVSFYYFYGNWLFELDELSLDDFVDWMIIRERPLDSPVANAFQMRHLGECLPFLHKPDSGNSQFRGIRTEKMKTRSGCTMKI